MGVIHIVFYVLILAFTNAARHEVCTLTAADSFSRRHTSAPSIFMSVFHLTNESVVWYIDLFRITRLYNPSTRVIIFTRAISLVHYPQFSRALAEMRFDVRLTEAYNFKDSSQDQFRHAVPASTEVVTRFCDYYSEAIRLGLDRVLALDADMALFTDARSLMDYFVEDLVTVHSFCSQMLIINNVNELGEFCQYSIDFFMADNLTKTEGFEEVIRVRPGYRTFMDLRDMELLHLYLHGFRRRFPTNSQHRVLCQDHFHLNRTDPSCYLSQGAAISAYHTVTPNASFVAWKNFTACGSVTELLSTISWSSNAQGLPLPMHVHTHECLPIIHFQGVCKPLIPGFTSEFYARVRKSFIKHRPHVQTPQ